MGDLLVAQSKLSLLSLELLARHLCGRAGTRRSDVLSRQNDAKRLFIFARQSLTFCAILSILSFSSFFCFLSFVMVFFLSSSSIFDCFNSRSFSFIACRR